MSNFIDRSLNNESFLPTVISFLIPVVQLLAVIIVDVGDTLGLNELFLRSDMLPVANILTLMLIAAGIGVYWYWKENFTWFNFGSKTDKPVFAQKHVKDFLFVSTVIATVSCVFIIISLVLGKSASILLWRDIFSITQILSYIIFVSAIGLIANIGLTEYARKQRDFKPEQYLNNLLSSMQNHGTIDRPHIHIKERRIMSDGLLQILVKLTINDDEKYLITSYDGREIAKELSATEYQQAVSQPSSK